MELLCISTNLCNSEIVRICESKFQAFNIKKLIKLHRQNCINRCLAEAISTLFKKIIEILLTESFLFLCDAITGPLDIVVSDNFCFIRFLFTESAAVGTILKKREKRI